MDSQKIYTGVHEHYTNAAQSNDRDYSERIAKQFGYSAAELESIPQDANLGLSCGNPHALANLKEGETVIDLGSGAGFDVFLAAKKVGPSGRAIGVDMNHDMLKKANQILANSGLTSVSFINSPITKVSLPDESADCIISNCVINLVPESEKQLVFNECFRLLKSGGRFAVSDILAKQEMPPALQQSMAAYVGCISGASQVGGYEKYLREAGFEDILIIDTKADLNVYENGTSNGNGMICSPGKGCCPSPSLPNSDGIEKERPNGSMKLNEIENVDFNEFAGSFKIFATKGQE